MIDIACHAQLYEKSAAGYPKALDLASYTNLTISKNSRYKLNNGPLLTKFQSVHRKHSLSYQETSSYYIVYTLSKNLFIFGSSSLTHPFYNTNL